MTHLSGDKTVAKMGHPDFGLSLGLGHPPLTLFGWLRGFGAWKIQNWLLFKNLYSLQAPSDSLKIGIYLGIFAMIAV